MATLQELDAAIAQLTSTETTIVSDVSALVNKLTQENVTPPDYANELAVVQSAITGLQNADVSAQAELNPTPAPTNEPATPAAQ